MDKKISFGWAILPLFLMVMVMLVTIIILEQGPHMPLIIGTVLAGLVAWKHGFTWNEIESMMYRGIRLALPAVIIIMLVGLVIGSWMGGGIVATMIYYGLQIISPAWFLVTIMFICSIVSIAIGSSWSTMATIGVAGMGIGLSMGIPAGAIAGAVISGAYFGDKMSPLSDTTNLAAGLTGTNLFDHIKHMFWTTIPAYIIAAVAFGIIGRKYAGVDMNSKEIQGMLTTINEHFVVSPWLLLVPVLIIVLVAVKVPAIPALVVGVVLGMLSHLFIQGGDMATAVGTLQSGFTIASGNEMVDALFNNGGIDNMMYTVSMTIIAMTFGGILEYSGMLKSIIEQILRFAKSTGSLVAATIASCFATNASCSEQYISIVVPARMFATAYRKRGLHSKNLSRCLEDGGTLTSVFIPWNTCGVFIASTLGVTVAQYAPYAILNFTVPILSILYGIVGFTIVKLSEQEVEELEAQEQRLAEESLA